MNLRHLLAFLAFASITVTIFPVQAATKTLTVTHTYLIGDNDSRNDARRLCLLEAKRKLLEEAGSFIQSSSEVKNLELTKDQITSYSAAILRVETMQESVDHRNGQNALTLTVKADIDTDEVARRLATIANDGMARKQIDEQQKILQQHEEAIKRLNSQIAVATPDRTRGLLEERNVVFADIDEMGRVHMAAKNRIQNELELDCAIAKKMKLYVLKGMTQREVLKILGKPYKKGTGSDDSWYYGDSSLVFDDPKGYAAMMLQNIEILSKSQRRLYELTGKYSAPDDNLEKKMNDPLLDLYQVKKIHMSDSCL